MSVAKNTQSQNRYIHNPAFMVTPQGNRGVAKRIKNEWGDIEGLAGESKLIHKEALGVDYSYQRRQEDQKSRSLAIARNLDRTAFGVLLVGERDDGTKWIVDGGTRHGAAMLRDDMDVIACQVFRSRGPKHEAAVFLKVNTQRKPVSAIQKHRAEVEAGIPAAIEIERLISDAGYTFCKNGTGKNLGCIRSLKYEYERDREVFDRIWPLVIQVANGGYIHEMLLQSLTSIESNLDPDCTVKTITKNPWVDRLMRLGSEGVIRAARQAQATFKKGGPKRWAEFVAEELNRGCHEKNRVRLRFPFGEKEDSK